MSVFNNSVNNNIPDSYFVRGASFSQVFKKGTHKMPALFNDSTNSKSCFLKLKLSSDIFSTALPTGYLVNGTDINTVFSAYYTEFNVDTNLNSYPTNFQIPTLPSNCKGMKVILIGSGGGGYTDSGYGNDGPDGPGGGGGGFCSVYIPMNSVNSQFNTFNLTIGTGGKYNSDVSNNSTGDTNLYGNVAINDSLELMNTGLSNSIQTEISSAYNNRTSFANCVSAVNTSYTNINAIYNSFFDISGNTMTDKNIFFLNWFIDPTQNLTSFIT